jgi:hypothetical protein
MMLYGLHMNFEQEQYGRFSKMRNVAVVVAIGYTCCSSSINDGGCIK